MSAPSLAHARSFLFVPADRPERLPKALASGAHAVIADLEDAVAPQHKAAARSALAQAFLALAPEDRARLAVRVNAAGSAMHDDDVALLRMLPGLGAVMLAKAESATAIERIAREADAPVIPLVESALGLTAIDLLARARGTLRLAFGHLDFQGDVGLQCDADERELDAVRLQFALASRRAQLPSPIDGVTVALDDAPRLEADTRRSRRFGFGAKLCIHPKQVAAVNDLLAPTAAEREWARRVVAAASDAGQGAFRLDGQMVDAPVLQRARHMLAA